VIPSGGWHSIQVGAIVMIALGCAPTTHTPQHYRLDHAAARAIEARAYETCEETGGDTRTLEHPFVTDGCTFILDSWSAGTSWLECCVEHDIAYWCGGSAERRREADKQLRQCVSREHSGWMGAILWLGTRTGGHRLVPTRWRWGYGHDYPAAR